MPSREPRAWPMRRPPSTPEEPAAARRLLPPCPPPGTCDPDAVTGATPGVASACREFGMASVDKVVSERGIRPPGVA